MTANAIPVKISSEAAGEISMTPVVTQEMALRELIEILLGVCGKDPVRISELLRRGTTVQGASRFRWDPVEIEDVPLRMLLAQFPESDPSRRFAMERCAMVGLQGTRSRMELSREIASEKRLLKRQSFWDILASIAEAQRPEYIGYSYREKADLYRLTFDAAASRRLTESAHLLKFSGLAQQIERDAPVCADLFVKLS